MMYMSLCTWAFVCARSCAGLFEFGVQICPSWRCCSQVDMSPEFRSQGPWFESRRGTNVL